MLRWAGNNERRCIIRESLGLYGSVVIAVKYRFSGRLDKLQLLETLQPAISACQKQHPLLDGVVFSEVDSERPYLARVSADLVSSLPNITIWTDSEKSEDEFLAESASLSLIKHSNSGLPWQVNALSGVANDDHTSVLVAFVASHGLADGRSGILFHDTLLKHLRGQDNLPIVGDGVPLAMEDCGKLSISPGFLMKPVLNEYLPATLKKWVGLSGQSADGRAWVGSDTRPAKGDGPKTCVHRVSIPAEQLSALLNVCRSRQVRLTSVLNHSVSHALSLALGTPGQDRTTFIVCTPLDLRGAFSMQENDVRGLIGVYPSSVDEVITLPPHGDRQLDWNAARVSTEELARLSNTLSDQYVGLLRYLSNYKQWLGKKSVKPCEASFGLSNLGIFDPGAGGTNDVGVEEITFAQSGDLVGETLNVGVASVKNGSLSIVFTWWPGMLGVDDEDKFVRDVGRQLVHLLAGLSASSETG